MGIATSPDIFQKAMNDVFGDLDYVIVYLDDILILSNEDDTFDDHLAKLNEVFKRSHHMGMKINLLKTEFLKDELDYLGYTLSQSGIKPQAKKVEAIGRILPPKNRKQLKHFLGMINYYRNMWPKRSHVLAPLSALASPKAKWEWTQKEQLAFEEAKQMIQREAMLAYPDFSKKFHIYADASDTQLGGVIMQDNKPLAFYTRKLNSAQARYTTGEQELLSIVETLRTFEGILMGQQLVVHTDHLNLLYKKLASGRLVRWRMILEEYGPEIRHIDGVKNKVADALSRLEMASKPHDEINDTHHTVQLSYVTQREIDNESFPMHPPLIRKCQEEERSLRRLVNHDPNYQKLEVEGETLVHYRNRIYIPEQLRSRIMNWYHEYLVHPGKVRMLETMANIMYWPKMAEHVDRFVKSCHKCQIAKKNRKKYGHLPPKIAEVEPWRRVNVDLIGPYSVKTPTKKYSFRAMTMIDPATNWFEIAVIHDPNSKETQRNSRLILAGSLPETARMWLR